MSLAPLAEVGWARVRPEVAEALHEALMASRETGTAGFLPGVARSGSGSSEGDEATALAGGTATLTNVDSVNIVARVRVAVGCHAAVLPS